MSTLAELENWYARHCGEDWEEQYGISIETLDNPGWCFRVSLSDTELAHRNFEDYKIDRSDVDWIVARKREFKFEAFGGPRNLKEMIGIFLAWSNQTA